MDERAKEVQRVLEAVDAVAQGKPPAVRARELADLLESVQRRVRAARREAIREMQAGGMTYRGIAAELGISFGRVRQLLAEDDPDAAKE